MVIKLYISVISCSQEAKKNQQRAIMILESKNIPFSAIDITDPAFEDAKDYMVETASPKANCKIPYTPQIYNEAEYCGDFEALDMANECDTLGDFLKLSEEEKKNMKIGITGILPTDKSKEEVQPKMTNGIGGSQEDHLIIENGIDHDMNEIPNEIQSPDSVIEVPPVENADHTLEDTPVEIDHMETEIDTKPEDTQQEQHEDSNAYIEPTEDRIEEAGQETMEDTEGVAVEEAADQQELTKDIEEESGTGLQEEVAED